MKHQKRETMWSLLTEYEGNRIKLRKGLEHWWENNHKTTQERVHNPFK